MAAKASFPMPGTEREAMSADLRVFGAVVFDRDGSSWRYDTARGGMIVLRDDGVLMPSMQSASAIVPWEAVREIRCWAPVRRGDRR